MAYIPAYRKSYMCHLMAWRKKWLLVSLTPCIPCVSPLCRLSERNCIEIVAKLVEEKKLDVVHTLDGKEYITPSQITREIRDELYIHGGQLLSFFLPKNYTQ